MKGSLLRANNFNRLKEGEKVSSRKKYTAYTERQSLVDHYARIKKIFTEHGDNGVKVYVLEVLAEVDRRIKTHNMKNDPKEPKTDEVEEVDVDDEFASDDLEDEEEDLDEED